MSKSLPGRGAAVGQLGMSRPLHLCFLTPEYALEPPFGGIATYLRDAGRWLVEHGHTVDVVCIARSGACGKADDEGVAIHFVPPRRIKPRRLLRWASQLPGCSALYDAYAGWDLLENSLGGWLAIHKLNRGIPYDLIEAADFGGLAFWGLLNPRRRVPLVLRGHAYLDLSLPHVRWSGRNFQHALERFCLHRADFVLTNSVFMENAYEHTFGVPRSRLGALELPFYQSSEASRETDLRQQLGWQAQDPIVIFVGWLDLRKGIDILFEALVEAHKRLPSVRAVFLGQLEDCPRSAYDAFMNENSGWTYHPGAVEPQVVEDFLRQVDLLVLPSRSEPLGRVLIEAQLAGLPVVGTKVGGIPEAVLDGVTGLLVEPDDAPALARALLKLCASQQLRKEMGGRARKWALERFEIAKVMAQQLQIYQALIDGQSPRDLVWRSGTDGSRNSDMITEKRPTCA